MSTPTFVPQPAALPTAIRYYAPLDPYHYTVDNRPLQDLETNLLAYGTQGVDAARRSTLIQQMAANRVIQDSLSVSSGGYFQGLSVSYSAGALTIGPGSLFITDSVYTGSSVTIAKQAILETPSLYYITVAGTGMSIDYLIQVKFNYLTTGVASALPYFDLANPYISSGILTGELTTGIKNGAAAATGTQVTPTADAGYIPLYVATFTAGAIAPTIKLATGAPSTSLLTKEIVYIDSTSSPASSFSVNGTSIPRFLDSVTQSIAFSVSLRNANVCPYLPIRLKISYMSTVVNNAVYMQLSTLVVKPNAVLFINTPVTAVESLTVAAVSGFLSTMTTASMIIPPSAFADYSNGSWGVSSESILFQLSRLGADPNDTNTGSLDIYDIKIVQ